MVVTGTATAIASGGLPASFLASGAVGTPAYSVLPNGAGGSIDPMTGAYTSPALQNLDPAAAYDTIQALDLVGNTATAKILVAPVLGLVCEIIQQEMELASGRVYIFDQKIMQPTDSGLYIAVSVLTSKPFANTLNFLSTDADLNGQGSINVLDTLSINIISRSNQALFRKEEVLLALGSLYAEQQQELNSFFIGRLPPSGQFVNLSDVDGAAIPYRFNISINVQYFTRKVKPVEFFDDFDSADVTAET